MAVFFEAKNVALYNYKRQVVIQGAETGRKRVFLGFIIAFYFQPWAERLKALPFLPFSVSSE